MPSKGAIVVQRVLLGAVAIGLIFSLFTIDRIIAQWALENSGFASPLLQRGSIIPLLFLIMLSRGVYELLRLLRAKGIRPIGVPAYVFTLALVALPWMGPAGYLGGSITDTEGLYWQLVGVFAAVVGVGAFCVLRNNPAGTIVDGASTLFIVLYLGFLASFGLQIRCGLSPSMSQGVWILLIVLLVTKSSDIGGFLIGSAIGRHKLIPTISPGKTVEGAIGGLIASGLVSVMFAWPGRYGVNVGQPPTRAFIIWNEMTTSYMHVFQGSFGNVVTKAFLFGVVLSFFSQVGDLFESCLKRDSGIKDSGAIMPHYGGVLDLVDSPLFTLPVAWFLLTRVWNVP